MDKKKWIKLITEAQRSSLSDERIVEITSEYANSGEILSFTDYNTADVPSTGGPSSLSTVITPLFLVQAGLIVPKLGVPGRPAGGLDTLAQISGYKINMSKKEIKNTISKCHYAHFISSGRFAPLDLDVFLLRKKNNAIALPSLVIASILSKKIAVGVKNICLDIRIAKHGNFGSNFTKGRLNAKQFIRIAKILKLRSICFLTDANTPFQPYIGRGEALWALHNIFTENYCSWLKKHLTQCAKIASSLHGEKLEISSDKLFRTFKDNIETQGADFKSFIKKVENVKEKHIYTLEAEKNGYIYYDLKLLRNIILGIQNLVKRNKYPDPCGVKLLKEPQNFIERGEKVMTIRIPSELWLQKISEFKSSFSIQKKPLIINEDEVVYE